MVGKSLGMSLRRLTLCGVVSIVLLLMTATPSYALNPVPGGEVVTTYLEGYEFAQTHRTHRGIDIAGTPGQTVVAPIDGTVSFSGTIPATETDGGATMLGVSLALQDGRTVTLMPFESTCVQEGQVVVEGEALGTLAASGDASSPVVHLHLGMKNGRAYEDPTWLLGASLGQGAQEGYRTEEDPPVLPDTGAAEGWEPVVYTGSAFAGAEVATLVVGTNSAYEGGIETAEPSITGTVTSGAVETLSHRSTVEAAPGDVPSSGLAARVGSWAETQLHRIGAFLKDMGEGALAGGLTLAAAIVASATAALLAYRRNHAGSQEERTSWEGLPALAARVLRASRGRSWQN